MNRLCDVLVFGGLAALLGGALTGYPPVTLTGAIAILTGLLADPQARHQKQRAHRRAHRARLMEHRAETAATLHNLAGQAADNRDFARWETEYCDSQPLPGGLDVDRWDG